MARRDARRRRILEGGQDRFALITGKKSDPEPNPKKSEPESNPKNSTQNPIPNPSPIPISSPDPSLTMVKPVLLMSRKKDSCSVPSTQNDQVARPVQNEPSRSKIREEPSVRRPERRSEPARAPAAEDMSRGELTPAFPKPVLIVADLVLLLAHKIPIGHVSAQQVNMAVAETEPERMLCTLIMAFLVILSYAGFPLLSSRIFRWIFLFRPVFLFMIADIALIARRIIPHSQKSAAKGEKREKGEKGEKDDFSSLLGDGFAWAYEARRALELGLMLQGVLLALLMDSTVYATLVVLFLSPFV